MGWGCDGTSLLSSQLLGPGRCQAWGGLQDDVLLGNRLTGESKWECDSWQGMCVAEAILPWAGVPVSSSRAQLTGWCMLGCSLQEVPSSWNLH